MRNAAPASTRARRRVVFSSATLAMAGSFLSAVQKAEFGKRTEANPVKQPLQSSINIRINALGIRWIVFCSAALTSPKTGNASGAVFESPGMGLCGLGNGLALSARSSSRRKSCEILLYGGGSNLWRWQCLRGMDCSNRPPEPCRHTPAKWRRPLAIQLAR